MIFSFPSDLAGQVEILLYHSCTSFEGASRLGQPLNIFTWFIDSGGVLLCVIAVCCSMLQCIAGCCSVLQCVEVCCSVLQCVAVCCSVLRHKLHSDSTLTLHALLSCSVLHCVAIYCSVLQYIAVRCSVLQCVAVCCSVLQCVAVCCTSFVRFAPAST